MLDRSRKGLGWQIGSTLIVIVCVLFAAAKVVVSDEPGFERWVDEQSRGMQVMRQGVNTLVTAASDPGKKVKSAIVITSAPGTLASAAELTQGYLAASPFLFASDVAPKLDDVVVTSAMLQRDGNAQTVAKAGSERCELVLTVLPKKGVGGAGWGIKDAHCTPQ